MANSKPGPQYPEELIHAHRIEDDRLYTPVEFVLEGLEILLVERNQLNETGEPYSMDRLKAYGDFIGSMEQEELFDEMTGHTDSTVRSGAKQLDPQHTPRTKTTFEFLVRMTQETAPGLTSS